MDKKILQLFFSLLFLFSITHPVSAQTGKTYFVATDGNDSNSGISISSPWRTIQKAANTTNPGDTVFVASGAYSERVLITRPGTSGAEITFTAGHVADPVNNSSQNAITKGFVITTNNIKVIGFEIANTSYRRYDNSVGAGVYIAGNYNTVENNYVHDTTLNGVFVAANHTNPTLSTHNVIRNNKFYHVGDSGLYIHGQYNLVENNEVWESIQCPPNLMAVEDIAPDNASNPHCPYYPALGGNLDANGISFFGTGSIFRKNYIHDISFRAAGINPANNDYNGNPHIDCFQSWSDGNFFEPSVNVIFEQNICDIPCGAQTDDETCMGFMTSGQDPLRTNVNLIIRNNIIRAFRGINIHDAKNLKVLNNLIIGDLSTNHNPGGVILDYNEYPVVKNNIFYNHKSFTLTTPRTLLNSSDIDYNAFYNNDGSTPYCAKYPDYTCLPQTHDLKTDPKYINSAASNFHLQPSSLLINAGATLAEVTNDYDGTSRPQGAGFDIGAYEFVSSSASLTPFASPNCPPLGPLGDTDCSGKVNMLDGAYVISKWGTNDIKADLDTNSSVGVSDLKILLGNWGKTP